LDKQGAGSIHVKSSILFGRVFGINAGITGNTLTGAACGATFFRGDR
jgi:hypothetical protein